MKRSFQASGGGQRYRRIMVLGRSHIGDCLLTTPALRALRLRFRDARLDVAIPRSNHDLLAGNPHLDDLIYRPVRSDWAAKARFFWQVRRRGYDLLVSFQEKSLFYGWLARASNAPRRVGLEHPRTRSRFTETVPVRSGVHEVEKYLAVTRALGCPDRGRTLDLTAPATARGSVERLLRERGYDHDTRFVAVNPGATTADKRWAPERFAAAAERLGDALRLPVLVLGGPGDEALASAVARRMRECPLVLAGKTSLGETAALLERCRLLVTNDTGPMHMASALAVPLVAVFGPTSHVKFGPFGAHSRIVRGEFPCDRCERPCLHRVSVEQVVGAALEHVDALPARPREERVPSS